MSDRRIVLLPPKKIVTRDEREFLSDSGQEYDRERDGATVALRRWRSHCRKCGGEFSLMLTDRFDSLEQTKAFGIVHCEAHRGGG